MHIIISSIEILLGDGTRLIKIIRGVGKWAPKVDLRRRLQGAPRTAQRECIQDGSFSPHGTQERDSRQPWFIRLLDSAASELFRSPRRKPMHVGGHTRRGRGHPDDPRSGEANGAKKGLTTGLVGGKENGPQRVRLPIGEGAHPSIILKMKQPPRMCTKAQSTRTK